MKKIALIAAFGVACSDYNVKKMEDLDGPLDELGMNGPVSDGDASVVDDGSSFGERAWSDGDTGMTAEEVDKLCELAANLTGYLDQFQTPGDGQVLFCHTGSGNGYILVDSDIDSCSAHLDHPYDVFPSTGCDS